MLFSLIAALVFCDELYVPRDLRVAGLIICLGLSRSFSTLLFVRACQLAKSQRIATLNYAQSLFGYTIDVVFYDYSLTYVEMIAVGTVLATGAVTFV